MQVLADRIAVLEHDHEAQAKVIWSMRTLAWRHAGLQDKLVTVVPNLDQLLDG